MSWNPRTIATGVGLAILIGSGVAYADDGSPGSPSPLNDMPYSKLKSMAAQGNMMTMMQGMMKKGVFLMGGQPTKTTDSKSVSLSGEIVDANCYTANGYHGHNHALCAKACILNGSPLTFLTADGHAYPIISQADFVPVPEDVYNEIGNQGLTVKGYVNDRGGVKALTIASLNGKSIEMKKMSM